MKRRGDRPVALAGPAPPPGSPRALLRDYEDLLDRREALEWPRLFDDDWRRAALDGPQSLRLAGYAVATAIEGFLVDFGRAPSRAGRSWVRPLYVEKAHRLRELVPALDDDCTPAAVEAVRSVWLDLLAAAVAVGIGPPDPVDELLETESARLQSLRDERERARRSREASNRGKESGVRRREQRDEDIASAIAACRRMRSDYDFKWPTLREIAASAGLTHSRLRHLTTRREIIRLADRAARESLVKE